MKRAHGVAIVVLSGVGVCFALAIRGDRRGNVYVDPEEAAQEAARADLERVRAERDDGTALARRLAGPTAGAPGPLLAGVRFGSLGASAPPDVIARIRAALATSGGDFTIDPADGHATATVSFAVVEGVQEIWGEPGADGWTDDHDGLLVIRGAAADDDHVELTWRPYETLAHMVAPGDFVGATPFSIVGAKVDDVQAILGARFVHGDPTPEGMTSGIWTLPPLGVGGAAPTVVVVFQHGVVIWVELAIDGSPEAALEALHAAYGEPARGPWRLGRVVIEADGARVRASLAP